MYTTHTLKSNGTAKLRACTEKRYKNKIFKLIGLKYIESVNKKSVKL